MPKMSVDVTNSPYSTPPIAPAEDGLGYSRHYAQRIRDLGKTSKESWIKRLWNHVFQKKNKEQEDSRAEQQQQQQLQQQQHPGGHGKGGAQRARGEGGPEMGNSVEGSSLPPINRDGSVINVQQTGTKAPQPKENLRVQFSSRVSTTRSGGERIGANSAPSGVAGRPRSRDRSRMIPVELANSPYLAPKDRAYARAERPGGRDGRPANSLAYRDQRRNREASRDQFYVRKNVHPYLSQHQDVWRPKITRAPNMINLEKRAKATADKAMKEAKIFTCVGPYPVDAYVRFSLRKRGWVEKFGPKANASTRNGTSSKLECECDEDFELICEQSVPAPWEEDHGIYAMMSRCARHFPAKFIWGGRYVNSLILKNEVVVNHFPKARYFSSKVLLTQSLKELPWQNDVDPSTFFPRCYVLGEDEKEDIIDDFRTTACIALLKWVLRMYLKGHGRSHDHELVLQRENTKYEEVTSSRDCVDETVQLGSIFDDIVTPEPSARGGQPARSRRQMEAAGDGGEESALADGEGRRSAAADSGDVDQPTAAGSDAGQSEGDYEPCADVDNVDVGPTAAAKARISSAGSANGDNPKEIPQLRRSKTMTQLSLKNHRSSSSDIGILKVLPNLRDIAKKKRGGEVPPKAIEWALFHLNLYMKSKNHEDIDLKGNSTRGLSQPQWDQLLAWFYEVSQSGAKVPITERKLRECEDMLRKMKKVWPQYEIDGKRNIWIIKPGDKSKGIGIEFAETLDSILKYVSNSTTQGTYVLQKYIERPLLIYRCKFDIRQWFLVTDWNPLTVWFYKESYLRICSQEFQYDTMHESVHLSNVAVQQHYLNGQRSDKLPDNNFLSSTNFKKYLSEIGAEHAWADVIYPGMKHAIVNTLIATQEVTENRKNAFELYGADFMLSEDYHPWLIEINASPGMAPSSVEKCKLCAKVIDDTIRVVIDRKENKNASTGDFEMAFKDNPMAQTKCVETKFILEGQRIRKNDLQRYYQLDQKNMRREQDRQKKENDKAQKAEQGQEKDEGDSKPGEDSGASEEEKSREKDQEKEKARSESSDEISERKEKKIQRSERKKEEKDKKSDQTKDPNKKEDPLKDSPYNKPVKKETDASRNSKGRDEKKKGRK